MVNSTNYYGAFNYPLIPDSFSDSKEFKLKVFDADLAPNYVTRTVRAGIFRVNPDNPEQTQLNYEQYVNEGQEFAEQLKHMRRFGIPIAPTYLTVGTNSTGEMTLYSSTELLEGENLRIFKHKTIAEDKLFAAEYNNLVGSLCHYFESCFKENTKVAYDIFCPRQYIVSEEDRKIYLFDTDSALIEPDDNLATYLTAKMQETVILLQQKFTNMTDAPSSLRPAQESVSDMAKKFEALYAHKRHFLAKFKLTQ